MQIIHHCGTSGGPEVPQCITSASPWLFGKGLCLQNLKQTMILSEPLGNEGHQPWGWGGCDPEITGGRKRVLCLLIFCCVGLNLAKCSHLLVITPCPKSPQDSALGWQVQVPRKISICFACLQALPFGEQVFRWQRCAENFLPAQVRSVTPPWGQDLLASLLLYLDPSFVNAM